MRCVTAGRGAALPPLLGVDGMACGAGRRFCVLRPLNPHEGLPYTYGLWQYG